MAGRGSSTTRSSCSASPDTATASTPSTIIGSVFLGAIEDVQVNIPADRGMHRSVGSGSTSPNRRSEPETPHGYPPASRCPSPGTSRRTLITPCCANGSKSRTPAGNPHDHPAAGAAGHACGQRESPDRPFRARPQAPLPQAGGRGLVHLAHPAARPRRGRTRSKPGHRQAATWLGLTTDDGPGLFLGWETNTRATCDYGDLHGTGACGLDLWLEPEYRLAPGQTLTGPAAFLGAADGDLDEMSYPHPALRRGRDRAARSTDERFPYVDIQQLGIWRQDRRRLDADLLRAVQKARDRTVRGRFRLGRRGLAPADRPLPARARAARRCRPRCRYAVRDPPQLR